MPKIRGQKTERTLHTYASWAATDDRRRIARSAGLSIDEKLAIMREREKLRPPEVKKIVRAPRIDEAPVVKRKKMEDRVDDAVPSVRPSGGTDVERDEISGAPCGDATFMLKAYYDDAGYSGLRVRREERFDRQTWSLINRLCVPVPKAKW